MNYSMAFLIIVGIILLIIPLIYLTFWALFLPMYYFMLVWMMTPMIIIMTAVIGKFKNRNVINFTILGTVLFVAGVIPWMHLVMRSFDRYLYRNFVKIVSIVIFISLIASVTSQFTSYYGAFDLYGPSSVIFQIQRYIAIIVLIFAIAISFIRYNRMNLISTNSSRHGFSNQCGKTKICVDCIAPFALFAIWEAPFAPALLISSNEWIASHLALAMLRTFSISATLALVAFQLSYQSMKIYWLDLNSFDSNKSSI